MTVWLLCKIFIVLMLGASLSVIPLSRGRLGRLGYLKRHILIVLIFIVCHIAAPVVMPVVYNHLLVALIFMICAGCLIGYCLSLVVRRLHDLDKSGWWVLIMLIPVVGMLFWTVLFFVPGSERHNSFG